MPNITSAKKAMRVSAKKRLFNDRRRRAMRKMVKLVRDLVAKGDKKQAKEQLPATYKALDKAAKSGVIKKNTASRQKSRLSKLTA